MGGDSKRRASATRDPAPVLSGSQTMAASICPTDSIGSSTARTLVADWPSGPVNSKPRRRAWSRVGPTTRRRGDVSACSRISSRLTSRRTPIMVRIESSAPNLCTMFPPTSDFERLLVNWPAIAGKSLVALLRSVCTAGSSVQQDGTQAGSGQNALRGLWHDHQSIGRGKRAKDTGSLLPGNPRYRRAAISWLESHPHIVPPLPAIVDFIAGHDLKNMRLRLLMPEHRADCRSAKDDEADRRRYRVTGKPQQRGCCDVSEGQGFPRFHADLPDRDVTFGLQDLFYQIIVP